MKIFLATLVAILMVGEPVHAAPSIDVPDGVFGQPVVATTQESKFVRAWCADVNGRVIYEQFVRPVNGEATFQLGPTNFWRTAEQATHCQGETGRLVNGRWTANSVDVFSVTG